MRCRIEPLDLVCHGGRRNRKRPVPTIVCTLAVRSEVGPPDRARLVVGEEKPGPVSREPARLCQGRLPSLVIVQCLNAAPGPGVDNTGGQVEAVDLVRTGHGDEE